ncbi:MAG: NAD(P)-binding domain-containing protein [Mycobacteriales bacterium]
MKIAVLGTGMVGQALAGRLAQLGHDVVVGTRDPQTTLAHPPFATWQDQHPHVRLATFAEAAAHGEVVVNASSGGASLAVLEAAGADRLAGKVLLDIANPLDFSQGFPPSLSVVNTDSLAEQIQRAFPAVRVVKSLNTMNCEVMVDPKRLPGDHDVLVAGDDPEAKATVEGLLRELGWPQGSIIDLGGLRAARGTEMYLPLWLSLMQALGSGDFNIKVVKA